MTATLGTGVPLDLEGIRDRHENWRAGIQIAPFANTRLADLLHSDIPALLVEIERLRAPIPQTYACHACGRRDGLDVMVTDATWARISRGQNILCLWCIDARCAEEGMNTTVSLAFAGRAVVGDSQSDSDREYIERLCRERDAADLERAMLRAALRSLAEYEPHVDDLAVAYVCFFCEASSISTAKLDHAPACPVLAARRALGVEEMP